MRQRTLIRIALLALLTLGVAPGSFAQSTDTGSLTGTVYLETTGGALHRATVLIVQLSRSTETDHQGNYRFDDLPPGTYDVIVRAPALTTEPRSVTIPAGGTATLDFTMRLAAHREHVTVTASGQQETPFEAFQAVDVLDSVQLASKSQSSLGEALNGEPGVAMRSFGPGTARPVIRGFDGDRVLIMKDSISTGTLSSQSGDHGETIDTLNLERLEVVKGPATLLYGSSAIGGVVNAITPHDEIPSVMPVEFSGYATSTVGSANGLGGGAAGFKYGVKNWLFWGSGSGNRTRNYDTPVGRIYNSHARLVNGNGGFGWYGEKAYANFNFGYDNSRYGIPPLQDEVVELKLHRHNPRVTLGARKLETWVKSVRVILDYDSYQHEEVPVGETTADTIFHNHVFSYRGVFEQEMRGPLTGRFGLSGFHRDYKTSGEEGIAPPVTGNNFALFTLQEIGLERFRVQLGGRLDHTSYDVDSSLAPGIPSRSFTGFSGAAGIHVPLWAGGAFVTNYTHSYRPPALEELYNHGPHAGNQTFEIGDPNLKHESTDGVDLSLRQQANRIRAELNFFYYHINNFVFLAPTGDVEEGLPVAEYLQGKSRFLGGEASLDVELASFLWLNLGADTVDAELRSPVTSVTTGLVTPAGTPLPRIPPLRGRVGFDLSYKGLSLRPEAVLASNQHEIFTTETRTPGYTVFNLDTSYTIARAHLVHVFSVSAFNLSNRLYFNHLSFIKDIAPEMGRGVRVSYTARFF